MVFNKFLTSSHPSSQRGFTLIELMVTIAIVAIVAFMAVPSYQDFMLRNRQSGSINGLLGALYMARSEAIKSGELILVCAREDSTTLACDAGATNWKHGWLIFNDSDNDYALSNSERIVAVENNLATNIDLFASTGISSSVLFLPDGTPSKKGGFTVCDPRGAKYAKSVLLNSVGRAKAAKYTYDGKALTCTQAEDGST